ncbi:hypothetical protein L3X38_011424 [Prunus dulcis]|uniref:Uncharacterized protein n=1 Tax=Prunus dulcis TaxID=3755 RepID=A0AAD4WI55_PRUDU|nr:hypothetical protein L3X38_011404 [Prunus dulcis]KAI5343548.1 hypothetical protein L3X38_011424 [Prunus dulcis]
MEAVREETKRIEARAKEIVLEAVRAEREILLKQFSQLIPNFDPNLLDKTPITPIPPIPQEQSPKNPMSDKASCSNTKLKPANETVKVHIPAEVFGTDHDTFLLCEDILQFASMIEIGSTVIAVYMRYLFDYLKMSNMMGINFTSCLIILGVIGC